VVDLVPITFAAAGDGTIVTAVDHKPKRTTRLQRLDNVRAHAQVTVLVDHYCDDWSALWWVRIRGTAVVVDEPAAELLGPLVAKYPQYQETRPAGPAIVITVEQIRSWSAGP
jgi:PPOX class probable F420-dependent enzyme